MQTIATICVKLYLISNSLSVDYCLYYLKKNWAEPSSPYTPEHVPELASEASSDTMSHMMSRYLIFNIAKYYPARRVALG